jgi:hypothetical protein
MAVMGVAGIAYVFLDYGWSGLGATKLLSADALMCCLGRFDVD